MDLIGWITIILDPGYTYAFHYDQVLLKQDDKKLKQVFPHCLLVP